MCVRNKACLHPVSFGFSSVPNIAFVNNCSRRDKDSSSRPAVFGGASTTAEVFRVGSSTVAFGQVAFANNGGVDNTTMCTAGDSLMFRGYVLAGGTSSIAAQNNTVCSSNNDLALGRAAFTGGQVMVSTNVCNTTVCTGKDMAGVASYAFRGGCLRSRRFGYCNNTVRTRNGKSLTVAGATFVDGRMERGR